MAEINGRQGSQSFHPLLAKPSLAQPSPATLVHKFCWMFTGNVLLQVAPNNLEY